MRVQQFVITRISLCYCLVHSIKCVLTVVLINLVFIVA
jgi:hypothetical protein